MFNAKCRKIFVMPSTFYGSTCIMVVFLRTYLIGIFNANSDVHICTHANANTEKNYNTTK